MVRGSLTEKVTFEFKPEGIRRRGRHEGSEEGILSKEKSKGKCQRLTQAWQDPHSLGQDSFS